MSSKKKSKPKGTKPATKPAAKAATKAAAKISPVIEEKKMTNKAEKITADAAVLGKEQMDAFMQSGNLWMKGSESLIKTYVDLAQSAIEQNTDAVKTLMACKTLNELTEVQAKLTQQSFDALVSNATKLSELSVKVATESLEPIGAQFSKTLKKTTDSVAA